MVIDYDKFPILKCLYNGDNIEIEETPDSVNIINSIPSSTIISFSSNVEIIALPFYECWQKNKYKLSNLSESVFHEIKNINGSVIMPKLGYNILYSIKSSVEFTILLCVNKTVNVIVNANANTNTFDYWVKNTAINDKTSFNNDEKYQIALSTVCELFTFLIFKKYAQIETKIIHPGQKLKGAKKSDNIKSNLPHNIKILDSTWFTNIIKTEGFGVSGHFRLQPCKKDGEWTRELIWINDFQKNGYTRKAGILTQP
jgi:hypothetical protein